MTRQFRSELRKLTTIRITAGFLGLALAYTLVNAAALLALQGVEGGPAEVTDPQGLRLVVGVASGAYLFSLVIGVMAATGEHRHGTIAATLLAQPRRARVVLAKVAATTTAGLVYGAVCTAACLAVVLPWLAAIDHAPLGATDVAAAALGCTVGVALFATIGTALGALVRNQAVALVAGLVWLIIGEGLLLSLLPEVGRWLPSGALGAVTRTSADVLPGWAGALVLLGYGAAMTAAAVLVDSRRDVG